MIERVNKTIEGMRITWGVPPAKYSDTMMHLIDNGLSSTQVVDLWCIIREYENRKKLWAFSWRQIDVKVEDADYLSPVRDDGSRLSFDDKVLLGIESEVEVDRIESLIWN